ncbi:esterase [Mycobacterium intermedium]|uniref:Esterase n=1 Tax=Mycobacterium intermedium TaxID=28445 RepID=A0A1E3SGI1_MYCIE|nr:alpha/beta hydrolase [Mycobacterium intermedium]MCV6966714.1 alpha/beta hydrolase [Mycobacterium intermedium]ODR00773.1 esterase [Mycobacterium intermedium]OPE48450.1 esterase [Mycobacterium intermedium]ORB10622.1 esterase [Mycobacterium intermedium]
MTLDPQIAELIDELDGGFPAVHTMTGAQARAVIRDRFVPPAAPEPVGEVRDAVVAGPDGDVPVRVYRPDGDDLPILVYAHGGGFVFCDLDSHDGLCRSLANHVPAVVVSVAYRLAPEHRWPAAADDVYAVVQAAAAGTFGGDVSRVAVGGDSAGGNLATVSALMARDRGGPALAAQLLVYPVIAADFETESYRLFGKGFYNPKPAMQWYWDQYVPSVADRTHPYAAPLHGDLRGLPPAVLVVAGHDPLRDEALAYAAALKDAGVPLTLLEFGGGIHGFMSMPMLDIAQTARRRAGTALSAALGVADG